MRLLQAIAGAALACAALAQQDDRTIWDGIYSAQQAERGQELYVQHCAGCHSDTLTGGEQAPALTGDEFISKWDGLMLGELVERVRTTMPIGRAGKLSRQVNTDIIAYMLSVGKYPPGTAELSPQLEVQRQVRILAQRPEKK